MNRFYKKLVVFLGSRTFFGILLGSFAFGALWLAVSMRYPMAFDEEYHLGLIKLHALQWSPLFSHQPTGIAQYGALTTDPSYLFHYFMSFPYRILTWLAIDEKEIVVTLRYINVALFTYSLYLMRKVLLKTKASPAVVNVGLLFLVLLPVVPFLAATINYDNLQNVLLAWGLLFLLRFRENLRKKSYDVPAFVGFMSVGLLASLVKFTFLPFLTAFAAYFLYATCKFFIVHKHKARKIIKKELLALGRTKRIALATIFMFSCGLFINSYGVNIYKYRNPIPQCGQVVDYQRCQAYSPWYRNYLAAITNKPVDPNPVLYTGQWLGGMFNRLLFVINGKGPVDNYQNYMAPLLALAFILLCVAGFILTLRYGYSILRSDGALALLLFVGLVYIASVWGRNYHDWLHLKKAVAINGRYLIPVLPFFFVYVLGAFQRFLYGKNKVKVALLSISLLLFLQGGGITSFIYYSKESWYWENAQNVKAMNKAAKKIVQPLFITYYLTTLDHIYQ